MSMVVTHSVFQFDVVMVVNDNSVNRGVLSLGDNTKVFIIVSVCVNV